jgi:hypothetical protein
MFCGLCYLINVGGAPFLICHFIFLRAVTFRLELRISSRKLNNVEWWKADGPMGSRIKIPHPARDCGAVQPQTQIRLFRLLLRFHQGSRMQHAATLGPSSIEALSETVSDPVH